MTLREVSTTSRFLTRMTVAGMSLAVLALGALAVWSAFVSRSEAAGLARSGVQITGQLEMVQALYTVRTETDELEDEFSDVRLARLRAAVESMPVKLARMQTGDSPEAIRVAQHAEPLVNRLGPAVERFLADPRGDIRYQGEDGDDAAEDAMEDIIADLEQLLNDSESDPARLLVDRLDNATESGQAVGRTAALLVPLGLGGVIVCAWLMRTYRRRSEAFTRLAMESTAREARTDQLTGLPNRRAVIEELQRRIDCGEPFVFALADLNGFKHYNDTFGHPAGDALLRRLGHKLNLAFQDDGYAARLGGDEFCVVTGNINAELLQQRLHEALGEEGDGFSVSAVSGVAAVPGEAADASAALSLADTRLYAAKADFHAVNSHLPGRATSGSRVLRNYHLLDQELDRTARLATMCATYLDLPDEEITNIERAAQLYDIGKVALPASILAKRGALTDEEHQFVRRHTAIGERLLCGVEDLEPVATIVRASQERWDGEGYPDQLAGDQIPIGSRIIAVVSAFSAMTSERPHATARSVEDAVAELHRCSGTQFDPAVVAAFTDVVTRGVVAGTPAGAAGQNI